MERPFSKVKGQALNALESGRSLLLPLSECPRALGSAGAGKVMAIFLLGGLLTVLHAVPALAGNEFSPSLVKKAMLSEFWNASLHRPSQPKPSGPLPDLPHGLRASWKLRCY